MNEGAWKHGSRHLLRSIYKALGSIPSITKKKSKNKLKYILSRILANDGMGFSFPEVFLIYFYT
jgi:hypothetical protein